MYLETFRRRPLVLLAAVLLPVLVIVSGWRALRASVGISEDAAQFDRELARREPEVIVFGSSLANRGVDLPVLARSLGIKEEKILLMQLPHSSLAHWYELLKNRVYANGHEPKLVLVVDAFTSMLNHDLLHDMQSNVDRLVAQMTASEPEVASKVFHIDDPEQFREYFVRQRASEYRQSLLDSYRDQVIGLLYARKGRVEEAEKIVEKVNEEVFANDQMDYSLHTEVATGLFGADKITHTDGGDYQLKRDALLPEMAALAAPHNTNIVYVRIPLPPSNSDMDLVPPDIEEEAVSWIGELGNVYLDMRALDLDDSYFEDMRHLNRAGSQLFTSALGRVLASMRALDAGASKRAVKGLEQPSSVVVEGAGVAVPSLAGVQAGASGCRYEVPAGAWSGLDTAFQASFGVSSLPIVAKQGGVVLRGAPGEGCVGGAWIENGRLIVSPTEPGAPVELSFEPQPVDTSVEGALPVRWVMPGTKVTFTFAEPWSLPENAFRVYVRGFAIGDSQVPVRVTVGEDAFTLVNQSGRVGGSAKVAAPLQPNWTLTIEVPAGGPMVMLHHLAIGAPPSTAFVLGEAESLHGIGIRVVGGRVEDTQHKGVFEAAPPPLPGQPRLRRAARNDSSNEGLFQLEKLVDLADSNGRDDQKPNKCTPVAILEDGVPLGEPHSACSDVFTKGQGRTCFAGETFIFAASDDTDPMSNGRTYTAALTPRRLCDVYAQKQTAFLRDSWWFYPGDAGSFTLTPEETSVFRDGPNLLEVEVMPHVAEMESPVHVTLYQGDRVVLDKTFIPDATLKRRRIAWKIDPPLPPRPGELRVRIENTSKKSFPLLTSLTLAESYEVSGNAASAGTESAIPSMIDGSLAQKDVVAVWTREPSKDALPEPKKGSPTAYGANEVKVFAFWPVSNSYLEKLELPIASPVRLAIDGTSLAPVTDRKTFHAGCDACFYHNGQALLFFLKGVKKESTPTLTLDPSLPIDSATGSKVYWLYPTGAVHVAMPEKWRAGPGQVTAEGIAFHPQKESVGAGLTLSVGDRTVAFGRGDADGKVYAVLEIDGSQPPVIDLRSEAPGNFLMLQSLRLQDATGVTWVLRPPDVP
jgi:hypothetical protein